MAIAAASAPSAAYATATRSSGAGPPSRKTVSSESTPNDRASALFAGATIGEQVPAGVYSRPDKSIIAISSPPSAATAATASVPHAAVRIQTPPSGFDWGDASIGALVVLGVMAAGFGATVVARRRTNSLARIES